MIQQAHPVGSVLKGYALQNALDKGDQPSSTVKKKNNLNISILKVFFPPNNSLVL